MGITGCKTPHLCEELSSRGVLSGRLPSQFYLRKRSRDTGGESGPERRRRKRGQDTGNRPGHRKGKRGKDTGGESGRWVQVVWMAWADWVVLVV